MSLSLVSSLAHLGVHLVEPGVDEVLLRRQVGVDLLMDLGGRRSRAARAAGRRSAGVLPSTAASRSADACSRTWAIASWTAASMVPRISAAARNCWSANCADPVGRHGHGPAGRHQIGDTGRRRGDQDAQQHRDDQHAFMMRMGVCQWRGCRWNRSGADHPEIAVSTRSRPVHRTKSVASPTVPRFATCEFPRSPSPRRPSRRSSPRRRRSPASPDYKP